MINRDNKVLANNVILWFVLFICGFGVFFKTKVFKKMLYGTIKIQSALNINLLNAKLTSYKNQFIDLQSKSIDWFLYDDNFGF